MCKKDWLYALVPWFFLLVVFATAKKDQTLITIHKLRVRGLL